MKELIYYKRYHNDNFDFTGLEWVSDEMFKKCYQRALEVFSRTGYELSEYHDVILTIMCNMLRCVKNKENPYSSYSTRVTQKIIRLKEDLNNIESINQLHNYTYDDYHLSELFECTEDILKYIRNSTSERNYDIYYDYVLCGKTLRSIGETYNISAESVRLIVEKCNSSIRRYVQTNYEDLPVL